MIFHSHANKTRFHKKGCALDLILKVRVFGTRKWPMRAGRLTRMVARTASTVCGKEPRCNKASLQRTYFVSPSWPFVIWRLQPIVPVTMKQQTVLAT